MRNRVRRGPAQEPSAADPKSPGWYPDPDEHASMRHWDGRRWGAQRQPRPGWAPPVPPSGEGAPAARRPGRRRWLLLVGGAAAVTLVVMALGGSLGSGPDLPPRSVFDEAFTTRADAVCKDLLPPIRADRPEPGPEGRRTAAELAPRIERAATGLDGLVLGLDALEVTPADQAAVDRWLADWRAYIAVGREYAATLRAGDESTGAEVGAETGRIGNRLFGFARANAMPACTP